MRGEETQLLGALGADAADDAVVCMPGTHSKWVRVSGGTVERFATFMTGELFGVVSRETILSHAVTGADEVYDTVFRQYGITRVNDCNELYEFAKTLRRRKWPKGNRAAALSGSGGHAPISCRRATIFPRWYALWTAKLCSASAVGNPGTISVPTCSRDCPHATAFSAPARNSFTRSCHVCSRSGGSLG